MSGDKRKHQPQQYQSPSNVQHLTSFTGRSFSESSCDWKMFCLSVPCPSLELRNYALCRCFLQSFYAGGSSVSVSSSGGEVLRMALTCCRPSSFSLIPVAIAVTSFISSLIAGLTLQTRFTTQHVSTRSKASHMQQAVENRILSTFLSTKALF